MQHPQEVSLAPHANWIAEQVGALRAYDERMTFPSQSREALTAEDYTYFFSILHEKFTQNDDKKSLKNLQFKADSVTSLEALASYLAAYPRHLVFENLTLIMPDELDAAYTEALKQVLRAASGTQLKAIEMKGAQSYASDAVMQALGDIIISERLAIDVSLPKRLVARNALQQQIDAVTPAFIQEKNIRFLEEERGEAIARDKTARPKRSRVKAEGKQDVSVDIELEQEVEVNVEVDTERAQEAEAYVPDRPRYYSLDDFFAACDAWEIEGSASARITSLLSKLGHSYWEEKWDAKSEIFNDYWGVWLGQFKKGEAEGNKAPKLSKEAIQFLLAHHELFQYGLDLKRLPPGFTVTEENEQLLIHFDKKLVHLAEYDALRVQLREIPEAEIPTDALFEAWCERLGVVRDWQALLAEDYNRDALRQFKRTLPEKLTEVEDKRLLLDVLLNEAPVLQEKVNALFERIDDLSTDAMLQLCLKYGAAGVDKLTTIIDQDEVLFRQLNTAVFKKSQNYAVLFDEDIKEAMATLKGLSANERAWFDALLKQHGEAQSNVHLPDLVNAFTSFLSEFNKLQRTKGRLPEFFDVCGFAEEDYPYQVKSMPTALSRILTSLRDVNVKHYVEQSKEESYLDLSGFGMIKAISAKGEKRWAFITRAMEVDVEYEKADDNYSRRYGEHKHTNKIERNLEEVDYNTWGSPSVEKKYCRMAFYRAAGFQEKNGQMALKFYQYVDDLIENYEGFQNGARPETKKSLYVLLGRVLSGRQNVLTMEDEAAVKAELDETLRLVTQNMSSIGGLSLPEWVQDLQWDGFLGSVPDFPIAILNHFVRFFLQQTQNPLFVANLLGAIPNEIHRQGGRDERTAAENAALDDSRTLVAEVIDVSSKIRSEADYYGASVYEGMKDYTEADYKANLGRKDNVFLQYVKTLKAIVLYEGDYRYYWRDEERAAPSASALVRLISTFKLKREGIKAIQPFITGDLRNMRLHDALELLRYASLKHGKKALSVDDLVFILNAAKDEHQADQPLTEVFKTLRLPNGRSMAKYFESGFLNEYSNAGVTEALLDERSGVFDATEVAALKKMLSQFSFPGDHLYYPRIVSKLVGICEHLDVIGRSTFVQKLTSSDGFYEALQRLSTDDHPFIAMLDEVLSKEAPEAFVGIVSNEAAFREKFPETDTGALAERVTLYLGKLLPGLRYMEDRVVAELDLLPVLQDILFRTPAAYLAAGDKTAYVDGVLGILAHLDTLIAENTAVKHAFLSLYQRYLTHYAPDSEADLLIYANNFVIRLQEKFSAIDDKNLVLSLCLHFDKDAVGDNHDLTPEGLLALFDAVEAFDSETQATLLKVVAALLNTNKGYTAEKFASLLDAIREDASLLAFVDKAYARAPYPELGQLMSWSAETREKDYKAFDIKPCHRERFIDVAEGKKVPLNGFHRDKADAQLEGMEGFDRSLLTEPDLARFEVEIEFAKNQTSEELLERLSAFKDQPEPVDYEALVAIAAELMYRSKGADIYEDDGKTIKLGSSMEINTTQYLAILTSLKTPGHVMEQIGTGEGKSRIMMASIVCQYALGKTVDFVTSDAQLATRDFVEFKPLFDMIGAESSLIFSDSHPEAYRKHGINFSDASNLSLFRNKAMSDGQGNLVFDEDKTNRALLLDEADKTYFDMAGTRFNYSQEGDESIRDMSWVYPLLMDYFEQKGIRLDDGTTTTPQALYYDDIDVSRDKFLSFAKTRCTKAQMMRLNAVTHNQVEQWQVSAVTASQLKYQEDFVIEPNTVIRTDKGLIVSSEARLLFGSRMSRNSKFSFGVHQCLHARLNQMRAQVTAEDTSNLALALKDCEAPFHILDEKQIVYSTTSKNFVDDYGEGTVKAVTGTYGSFIERQEAGQLYGGADGVPLHCMSMPRDKGMQRLDRPMRLTRNKKQQIEELVQQIKKAREKNQPILVIAENDEESEALYKALSETHFKGDKAIQRIHSQLSSNEERDLIGKAGNPQQITVSTEMIGRGTDIILKGEAKKSGLNVLCTYLPRERDLNQIIGRSGRQGQAGETRLVLDKQRLRKQFGKKQLERSGFYYNVETYIKREQALMDRSKQCERLIKNMVGDFRKHLEDNFFNDMFTAASQDGDNRKNLLITWSRFFDKTDKVWNERWPHIQALLKADEISLEALEAELAAYQDEVAKLWQDLYASVEASGATATLTGISLVSLLDESVPELVLHPATKQFLEQFDVRDHAPSERVLYDHYDRAHDGRYVEYTKWSIPVLASLKGWANLIPFVNFENARPPFANTRAWWGGHGQLFPWFSMSKNKGQILGLRVMALVGALLGVGLLLTGVLAPVGAAILGALAVGAVPLWAQALVAGFAGLILGGTLGGTLGMLYDYIRHNEHAAEEDKIFDEVADTTHTSKILQDLEKAARDEPKTKLDAEPRTGSEAEASPDAEEDAGVELKECRHSFFNTSKNIGLSDTASETTTNEREDTPSSEGDAPEDSDVGKLP